MNSWVKFSLQDNEITAMSNWIGNFGHKIVFFKNLGRFWLCWCLPNVWKLICAWWQSRRILIYMKTLSQQHSEASELALKYESCLFSSSPACLWARVCVWAASKNWKSCLSCCLCLCLCLCLSCVKKNWKSCLSCLSPGCLWARVPVWAASKNWKCESCGWLLSWWEKIDRIWWTWTGRRAKFSILFTEAHPLQLALWALHGKEDRYEKLAKSDPVSDLETNDIWLMNTESRKMDSGNLHYI